MIKKIKLIEIKRKIVAAKRIELVFHSTLQWGENVQELWELMLWSNSRTSSEHATQLGRAVRCTAVFFLTPLNFLCTFHSSLMISTLTHGEYENIQ